MRAEAAKIAVCVRRREPSDESSAEEDGGPLQVQKHQAGHTSIILQAEHASTSIQQPRQLTIDGFFEDCPCSCPQLAAFLHRELVDNLFLGFNCSLLGCGSAEARKHVLSWETFGSVWSSVMALDRQRRIEQGWLSFLHFSACEITNEAILDLGLQPGQRPPSLRVRQHPQDGPFVHGLQRILVRSADHSQELIKLAASNKTSDCRGHQMVFLHLVQVKMLGKAVSESHASRRAKRRCSKLSMVLLAESSSRSSSSTETNGSFVQASLSALALVIKRLTALRSHESSTGRAARPRRPSAGQHVPFRQTNLTWLLRDSLGGNAKTLVLACISPCCSRQQVQQSRSTLRLLQSMRPLVTYPQQNEIIVQLGTSGGANSSEPINPKQYLEQLETQMKLGELMAEDEEEVPEEEEEEEEDDDDDDDDDDDGGGGSDGKEHGGQAQEQAESAQQQPQRPQQQKRQQQQAMPADARIAPPTLSVAGPTSVALSWHRSGWYRHTSFSGFQVRVIELDPDPDAAADDTTAAVAADDAAADEPDAAASADVGRSTGTITSAGKGTSALSSTQALGSVGGSQSRSRSVLRSRFRFFKRGGYVVSGLSAGKHYRFELLAILRMSQPGGAVEEYTCTAPLVPDLDEGVSPGKELLFCAVQAGDVSEAAGLLEFGVPVDCTNDFGRTPAHLAARNGDESLLRCLHQWGCDLHRTLDHGTAASQQQRSRQPQRDRSAPSEAGDSAFHLAAWAGHLSVLRWMHADAGVEPARSDSLGQSAAHIAARRGHAHVLQFLDSCGLDMQAEDVAGRTPLAHAVSAGQAAAAGFLRRIGA